MDNSNQTPLTPEPHPDGWAKPESRFSISKAPEHSINLNVEGRDVMNPLKGFGQCWQKTYRVRLSGVQVTPQDVIKRWKENFPSYWPAGNRFYGSSESIQPGDVALLNLSTGPQQMGGLPLISTGVMVIYADDESFTFATPQGHMFSGWITFSSYVDDESITIAQAKALIRASDPLFEVSARLFGFAKEDEFWQYTLTHLAASYGVQGQVQTSAALLDPKIQWAEARNIWHNSGVRTMLYTLGAPFRWIGRNLGIGRKP